jgi:hypothetical protein
MRRQSWSVAVLALLLVSCMEDDPSTEMYICAPHDPRFTPHLAVILRQLGFTTALGTASDGRDTMFVLDATRGSTRVWAQNQPANPPYSVDDIKNYAGPGIMHSEYAVTVQRRYPLYRVGVRATFDQVRNEILRHGYKVGAAGDCESTEPSSSQDRSG